MGRGAGLPVDTVASVVKLKAAAQLPLWHWLLPVHATSSAFLAVHVVPLHQAVDLQFVSDAQEVRHAVLPPHHVRLHSLPGSVPEAMTVQVPLALAPVAALQDWQVEVQAALQQKPSTQKPERHWLTAVQEEPCAFFAVQVPPVQ